MILLFQVLGGCSRSLDGLQTLLGTDLHAIPLPGYLNAAKIRDPAPFSWSNTYYVGLISTVVSMNKVLQLSIMPFTQSSFFKKIWVELSQRLHFLPFIRSILRPFQGGSFQAYGNLGT